MKYSYSRINTMKATGAALKFIVCVIFLSIRCQTSVVPEQIHVSYGESPSTMVVTWNTPDEAPEPHVTYRDGKTQNKTAIGVGTKFGDGVIVQHVQWIYRANLSVYPGTRYYYEVGSSFSGPMSETYSFVSMRTDPDWSPRLAVFGDLGLVNPQSVPRLREDVHEGMYDAILHVGDFAYDMATLQGRVGDAYMNMMQSVIANVSYMTCPGNHELHYNFSDYRARFSMPGNSENIFFSFDMGPVHFVSISTEIYIYIVYGISQIQTQFQWLENDLKMANLPENRAKRPWIILYGHRPMYCSNVGIHCTLLSHIIRDGYFHRYPLETLLQKYGVDLTFWGHEHSYERLWPILNGEVRNGTTSSNPYHNPKGPVHIVTGSAGCQERETKFKSPKPFSAFRSNDYGYTRLYILNSTHINIEQVSDDQGGAVIDRMTLIRDNHGPFQFRIA